MAYGDSMAFLPALSRLFGEVEQPTQTQGMMAPQFGGSPEQLGSFLQSPHMQEMMKQWGVGFNPQQVRQSPFFPNSFMQGHPQLGHALSGAMANVAATPEAPLVSGAGSGMSRAMQGMMGGPEMQRQYQIRQMMAPFQAMGAQIPLQEFQRKQQLLSLLQQMEQDRSRQAQEALQMRGEEDRSKQEFQRPKITNVQGGYVSQAPTPGSPEGGRSGADMMPQPGQGGGRTLPGGVQAPGWALSPEQQPGWQEKFTATDPDLIRRQAEAKETPAQRAQRLAKADADKAKAAGGGKKPFDQKGLAQLEEKKGAAYGQLEKEYAPYWTPGQKGNTPEVQQEKQQELGGRKQQIEDWYTQANRALGGQPLPYQYPGQKSTAGGNPLMAPQTQPPPPPMQGGQAGGGQPGQFNWPPGAHVDDEGNVWDEQGTQYFGNIRTGPLNQ